MCFAHIPWRVRKRRTPCLLGRENLLSFSFVSPFLLGKPNLDDTCLLSGYYVSPYLLGKRNLDDTNQLSGRCRPGSPACVSPISHGASGKGELPAYLTARTCFLFRLFRLFCLVSQIWMIHAYFPTAAGLALRLMFRPYRMVSGIWMIQTNSRSSLPVKTQIFYKILKNLVKN